MRIFRHRTHTVYEIRPWSKEKHGLVFIRNTGSKMNLKTLFHSWAWHVRKKFWLIRAPFFWLSRDNGGIQIGTPNFYL